jgi:2-C-methyl-D-erythritol 2,4-cyclodiphosphate synthase
LEKIMKVVRDRGFQPVNLDATIVAQQPRLAPHIPTMQANLAPILGLTPAEVNIKATTTEHMGFAGRGEGMAAYVVVLVAKS